MAESTIGPDLVEQQRHPLVSPSIEILTSIDKPHQIPIDKTSMQGTQATDSNHRASQSPSYHLLNKLTKALKEKMTNRLV